MKCAILKNEFTVPQSLAALPIVEKITEDFKVYLIINPQGIQLYLPSIAKKKFQVDFSSQQIKSRLSKAGKKNELIIRACSIKKESSTNVLDATAGFGRDAFVLASAGFNLFLVERHPVIYALLQDGITRLENPILQERLSLIHENSEDFLRSIQDNPLGIDVIYLDPMFAITRNAKVKKEMQILQEILDDDEAKTGNLLPLALDTKNIKRVVVKRFIHAPALNDIKPNFSLMGKHSRFDVYTLC